jgi:hypothetical protein
MSENTIVARGWTQDTDVLHAPVSWKAVCLFSLLGIVLSAVVLLSASDETIASVSAALAVM